MAKKIIFTDTGIINGKEYKAGVEINVNTPAYERLVNVEGVAKLAEPSKKKKELTDSTKEK